VEPSHHNWRTTRRPPCSTFFLFFNFSVHSVLFSSITCWFKLLVSTLVDSVILQQALVVCFSKSTTPSSAIDPLSTEYCPRLPARSPQVGSNSSQHNAPGPRYSQRQRQQSHSIILGFGPRANVIVLSRSHPSPSPSTILQLQPPSTFHQP